MTDLELYKSFVFRQFTFAPGHRAGYPNGAPYHYVGYLHRGTARLAGEDGVLELKEGDLFYIPRGCRYRSYWDGEEKVCFDSFAFEAFLETVGVGYRLQKIQMTDELRALHGELTENLRVNLYSVSLLYQIVWKILPNLKQSPYHKKSAMVQQIINYIYEHPDERSDLVARQLGISESTLYHLLKQQINKTPNLLRREAKCQQAVNLLTCTDLSVEQVSIQLGFSSASYMRKLLYSQTGKTPLQIRKSAQNL